MSSLPHDLGRRIEKLCVFLNLPDRDHGDGGIDALVPLVELIKDRGGVFVLKWDGERSSRPYTAVVSHPEMDAFRLDDKTLESVAAQAILRFAEAVLGFENDD